MKHAAQPPTVDRHDPRKAAAAHQEAIDDLRARIAQGLLMDCAKATWSQVGTLGHARELLVQVAFALGQITEEEAKAEHGVIL